MSYIKVAEHIAHKYNTRNPITIAKNMDISVVYLAFGELYGLACSLGKYRLIGVNSELDEHIQKLVAAHELGHFVLHPEENFFFIKQHTLFYDKYEYQANLFAVALCLGENIAQQDIVKELVAGKIDNLHQIARVM